MEAFRAAYPTLCELLEDTPFEGDAAAAAKIAKSKDDMKTALQERVFTLNELMWLLCGAVVPEWANPEAVQLEDDLAAIVGTVGIGAARTAYKDKFLVDDKNRLEDVRYELAVTAKACGVLDARSIQLEKPIPNPKKDNRLWKNSDVFGTFRGQPVRIEVTVLHESLSPAIHIELDGHVRQAKIASGFRITLRSLLVDEGYAERVRAIVELLHENHLASGGENVEIDGIHFEWMKGTYYCSQETSPFESICFYGADELAGASLREIAYPCSVRPVTSKHVLEDHPNPSGVVTLADLPDASTQVPVSTKVGQMLGGKRQQCEEGVINIVALGNPLPMNDRAVLNALRGSEYVSVPFWTDKHGVRHSGKGVLLHDPKAPFVPEQYLGSNDDRIQFIEPFKMMSTVWHIRLGRYAKSEIICNPNASIPIPRELVEAFSDQTQPPMEATHKPPNGGKPSPEQPDDGDQEEDIIWADIAQNYVDVCGTISEARSVLVKLERAGLSFDELRKKVEQVWSKPPKEEKKTKFISPTNEEMAMTFVADCGGYEQAKACLDAYAEQIRDR